MDRTDKTEEETSKLLTRRRWLKLMAAAPLGLVFGLALSPIARYLKPTMRPLNFFQPPDQPAAAEYPVFASDDLRDAWSCIPFIFEQQYLVYGPEQEEIRKIPGFVIRLPSGEAVAYSRICPYRGCSALNYVRKPEQYNCGCVSRPKKCCCAVDYATPLMICPCDGSAFDVADHGRVVAGPAPRPPRRFEVTQTDKLITITAIEQGGIA